MQQKNVSTTMGDSGNSPVHLAVKSNNIEQLKQLLAKNALDINKKNSLGENPFDVALKMKNFKVLETLVSFITRDCITLECYTKLIWDLLNNNYLSLAENVLINVNYVGASESKYDGKIPKILCSIVEQKFYKVAEFLVNHKVDLNTTELDKNKKSPLYMACENGDLQMVKLLLVGGVDVDFNKVQIYPFVMYAQYFFPIHAAIYNNHYDIVVELLNHIDVNKKYKINDKDESSLLHFACSSQKLEVFKLLLAQGANVNILNTNGKKPINATVNLPLDQFFVDMIEHKKFKLTFEEAKFIFNWTIEFKRYIRFERVFNYLNKLSPQDPLRLKIYQELINNSDAKRPLLHKAARWNSSGCIDVLVRNGAEVYLRNKYGRTAFHVACRYRQFYSVKTLIENGADVHARCPKEFWSFDYLFNKGLCERRYETDEEVEEEDDEEKQDNLGVIVRYIAGHIEKLSLSNAHQFTNEFLKYQKEQKNYFENHKEMIDCRELDLMKQTVIKGGFMYHKFIQADPEQRAEYLKEPIVYQIFSSPINYKYLFPDFAAAITYAFQSGLEEKRKKEKLQKA